jgi:hypothetical protein
MQAADYLRERCSTAGISNVFPVVSSPLGFDLPEKANFFLCSNTIHHIENPTLYFETVLRQHAAAKATLLLIDFKPGRLLRNGVEIGPKEEWVRLGSFFFWWCASHA